MVDHNHRPHHRGTMGSHRVCISRERHSQGLRLAHLVHEMGYHHPMSLQAQQGPLARDNPNPDHRAVLARALLSAIYFHKQEYCRWLPGRSSDI